MSNYNIQVSWSGKDALSDSDPAKIISGADFQTEFEAVKTAVNTKADINGTTGEDFDCADLTVAGNIAVTGTVTIGGTAVTATAAELNALDGITSTVDELNLLDGLTDVGTNAAGNRTVSTSSPTGGSDGDIWYQVAS
jgi:hypothetical protein